MRNLVPKRIERIAGTAIAAMACATVLVPAQAVATFDVRLAQAARDRGLRASGPPEPS